MSQWLQSAKATVSAGAAVISFTDNKDFASVRAGDVVMLNGQIWQCASGTRPDSAGKSTVTLAAPWPYTGASNVNAFVFRTTHDLLQLTSDARKLTNITKALLAAQEDILKGTTPTINVPIGLDPATGNEEVIAVTPWQYVINVVNASLGNISAIGAMSQAQFEAIRAQYNEQFAASGFVHFGKHRNVAGSPSTGSPVNEGLWCYYLGATPENSFRIGIADGLSNTEGKSKIQQPIVNIAGVIFEISQINVAVAKQNNIKFPQAPDGKTTYNKSTGVITNNATVTAAFNAQAADSTNVEVVTDRVDMWGFEAWLEEVNTTNPYVYPNGLIQSQATTMEGITTLASARPVTYYAVFDEDTRSKGKGLNYFSLSDENKKKVLANPKNNIYFLDDGRLVQWRLRQRTIAGAGNGDWNNLSSISSGLLQYSTQQYVWGHGLLNSPTSTRAFVASGSVSQSKVSGSDAAVFSNNNTQLSVNGECYFLVCGTVNRLNRGAYHPSFNPSGTACMGSPTNTGASIKWYGAALQPINTKDCFDGARTVTTISGSIRGDTIRNGRPDDRYYDAIYADGQGGVCRDMRYSANGVDLVDFAEADQKVKNGTYRGFEVLSRTFVCSATASSVYYSNANLIKVTGYSSVIGIQGSVPTSFNDLVFAYISIDNVIYKSRRAYISTASNDWVFDLSNYTAQNFNGRTVQFAVIQHVLSNTSAGGSFLQTDVIGNPANILATPQLANGWQGNWIPEIPDGLKDYFTFTRKYIGSGTDVYRTYTSNNGSSWTTGVILVSGIPSNQSQFDNMPANYVTMYQYKAFSKQTESAVNGIVYGGIVGVGQVFASSYSAIDTGVLLCESLLNKFLTSATNQPLIDDVALTKLKLQSTQKLATSPSWGNIEHNPISLNSPLNGSIAFKALNYNVNINQQAFIQYAYTELKHDDTSWGDDGKVTIVDNQATKTDLNGNTVLVGTAKLKEPIGWIKNKV